MRGFAILPFLFLAVVPLAPNVMGTSATPDLTGSVSGDASVGGIVVVTVRVQPWLVGRPLELVASPQVRVQEPVVWTPDDDELVHDWRIKVIGGGFWQATVVSDGVVLERYCCAVGWSGLDAGEVYTSGTAQTEFSSWQFAADFSVTAHRLNATWVEVQAKVHPNDPRLAKATIQTRLHGQPGGAVQIYLPERGLITNVWTGWQVELPNPAGSAIPPLRFGGRVACASIELDWNVSGGVDAVLSPCLAATPIPNAPPMLLGIALALLAAAVRKAHP